MEKLKRKYKIMPFIPVVGFIFVFSNITNYPNIDKDKKTINLILISAIIQGISIGVLLIYLVKLFTYYGQG